MDERVVDALDRKDNTQNSILEALGARLNAVRTK